MNTRMTDLICGAMNILHCGCGGQCSLCQHQPRPDTEEECTEVLKIIAESQRQHMRRMAYATIEHALLSLEQLRQTYQAQNNYAWVRLTEVEIAGYMDAVAGNARATYAEPREMRAYNEGYLTAKGYLK